MLFASTELAARIEQAECRLLTTSAAAIEARRPEAPVTVREVAGGVAVYTGPGSPLNKVAGLGFAGEPSDDDLDATEAAYAGTGAAVQVELASLADPGIAPRLTARGYSLVGFENVMGRALPGEPPPALADGVTLREIPGEGLAEWLDVAVTGFMTPDTQGVESHESFPREALEQVIADMAGAAGMRRWIATRDNEPAGAASMRLDPGRIAQLCGAATLPAHRRRGVQASLLAGRLAHATARGCELAVVTVLPGSTSMANVMKQGFELLYVRAILVKQAG